MKNKYFIIAILVFLISLIGISYAYFSAIIGGSESSTTITANSGEMSITFANGSGIITANNIVPSSSAFATKNFTVTGNNSTNDAMYYRLKLIIEDNTFSDRAISYTLSSTNTSSNGRVATSISSNIGILQDTDYIILGAGKFLGGLNKIHNYSLKLYFLDNNQNQSIDMNKNFKAHVEIESMIADEISFTIDNVLYKSLYNMSWSQWLNSDYNTGNFTTNSYSSLVLYNANYILQKCIGNTCTDVNKTDLIIESGTYYLDY